MALVKLNNRGVRSATAFGSITGLGSMVFIKKQTISSSATVDFVNGTSDVVLDNTYKEYLFTWNNIHPSNQGDIFKVNFSDDTSSHSYDLTKTTAMFRTRLDEDDSDATLEYASGTDIAQGTGNQDLITNMNNNNDSCCAGYLHLFNPSSTTFVKHFIARGNSDGESDRCFSSHVAGYINTTAAVTAVRFSTGGSNNIDAGDICLYGIN
tara:strand:- start:59 stop:685 length:627 start_codon:yes stop_codon:yes gene_type:complete